MHPFLPDLEPGIEHIAEVVQHVRFVDGEVGLGSPAGQAALLQHFDGGKEIPFVSAEGHAIHPFRSFNKRLGLHGGHQRRLEQRFFDAVIPFQQPPGGHHAPAPFAFGHPVDAVPRDDPAHQSIGPGFHPLQRAPLHLDEAERELGRFQAGLQDRIGPDGQLGLRKDPPALPDEFLRVHAVGDADVAGSVDARAAENPLFQVQIGPHITAGRAVIAVGEVADEGVHVRIRIPQ